MPGTLPHTQNGFAQTAAEQHFREELGDETRERERRSDDAEVRRQSGGVGRGRGQRPLQPDGPFPPSRALKDR